MTDPLRAYVIILALAGGLVAAPSVIHAGDLTLPFQSQTNYAINSWFDHTAPLLGQDTNPTMTRYDGQTGYSYNGHNGIDYSLDVGTPVLAAVRGTVVLATPDLCGGNYIRLYHSELGYSTLYFHLDSFVVTSGPVQRGQLIAYSGNTGEHPGCITGPHLHFTARDGQTGQNNLDPYG